MSGLASVQTEEGCYVIDGEYGILNRKQKSRKRLTLNCSIDDNQYVGSIPRFVGL